MYKLLTYQGYDARTGPHIFPIEADVDKSIGHIKMARELPPAIESYIRQSQPVEGKTQLLIDAMGAGEYYGSNVNGDYFPEEALRHDGGNYGHKTFEMYAYPFKHHVNKDPARAYGDKVVLSAYDNKMHRVLLIVRVDDSKCQDILGDLDNNVYWDVSMGCKVPWDECSICHNRAKNRSQYCSHLRYQMNKILGDGRRVFAYNRLPKFFDISFVTIGAEKASHVLKKVAHQGRPYEVKTSAELGEIFYAKLADQAKRAEMVKEVPSQPPANIRPATQSDKQKAIGLMNGAGTLKSCEGPIPNHALDQMAQHPAKNIFSTLAALGVDLKPQEFQRIILTKQGQQKLANTLERRRLVFDETKPGTSIPKFAQEFREFDVGAVSEKIAMIIRPWLRDRSCYPEVLAARIPQLEKRALEGYDVNSQWHPMTQGEKAEASGMPGVIPASAALAAGLMVFRKMLPQSSSPMLRKALVGMPWMLPILMGAGVGAAVGFQSATEPMPLRKNASVPLLDGKKTAPYDNPSAEMITLAYVNSATNQCPRSSKIRKHAGVILTQPRIAGIAKIATHDSRFASSEQKVIDAFWRTELRRKKNHGNT
jgi:hypothetical protein